MTEKVEKTKKIQLKADKSYSICSCGKSKVMPYCDGTHRDWNEKNSCDYKSIKIIADKDVELSLDSAMWIG